MKYLVIGALVATAIGGVYLAVTMTSGATEARACMPGQVVDGNGAVDQVH